MQNGTSSKLGQFKFHFVLKFLFWNHNIWCITMKYLVITTDYLSIVNL